MTSFRETECHSSSGFPKLHERTYDEVRAKMLDAPYDEVLVGNVPVASDGLFTSVMSRIHQLDPEVILFPAYSAVPLSYAVDSFYDGIGQQAPVLTYIRANQELAVRRDVRPVPVQAKIDLEVQRLREFSGAKAAVIDHFTATGSTLALAEEMLHEAKAVTVGLFSKHSKWYFDIDEEDKETISLRDLRYPRHEAFMRDVGARAARRLKPLLGNSPQK